MMPGPIRTPCPFPFRGSTPPARGFMRTQILLFLCFCLFLPATTFAADKPAKPVPTYSANVTTELVRLQLKLATVHEVVEKGEITDAQAKSTSTRLLDKARSVAGNEINLEQINAIKGSIETEHQQLTWLQKIAGLVTFVNIMWMLAILLGVICFIVLFKSFLRHIPSEFYEFVGYGTSIALVYWGNTLNAGVTEYVTFTGSLLFVGLMVVTVKVHRIHINDSIYFGLMTAVLGASAILTQNSITGFATSIAFMAALGFSVAVIPGGYVTGFREDSALSRATNAGFMLLFFFVGMTACGLQSTRFFDLFRDGALWMGSFVGYLGLLIASTRWYRNRQNYAIMQIITIAAGIAALFLGSVLGISELQKIGGTFFVLYLIEKMTEIPARSIEGYAAVGIVVAGGLWGISWFIKSHAEQLAPYVFGF